MRILLLGAPGVGKGTQAKLISEHFKIPHISTGDLFRYNIDNMTSLGAEAKAYIAAGKLVPDELTVSMVKERLSQADCNKGFILDGFPRNLYQAIELEIFLSQHKQKINSALLMDIPTSLIIERTTGRRVCPVCGANYNIKFKKPKLNNNSDVCGEVLLHRRDNKKKL
jgi:adenylate kinase